MSDVTRCKDCEHWKPLFAGETWGVRSFSDVPLDVREDIIRKLEKQKENVGYSCPVDVIGYHPDVNDSCLETETSVPGTTDWPYWGECQRTEFGKLTSNGSLAIAMDGSHYMAVLRTRCNFGCVQGLSIKAVVVDVRPD